MINQPTQRITFHFADAGCYWSDYDDSINVHSTENEDSICIEGVDADAALTMCRNALCAHDNVLTSINASPHQLEQCKEMLKALETYLTNREESKP